VIRYDDRMTAGNDALSDGPGQHGRLAVVVDTRVDVGHPLGTTAVQLTAVRTA